MFSNKLYSKKLSTLNNSLYKSYISNQNKGLNDSYQMNSFIKTEDFILNEKLTQTLLHYEENATNITSDVMLCLGGNGRDGTEREHCQERECDEPGLHGEGGSQVRAWHRGECRARCAG